MVQKMITTVSLRNKYSLGIILDKRICQKLGIGAGNQVEQFEHPTMKGVICIRKPKGG